LKRFIADAIDRDRATDQKVFNDLEPQEIRGSRQITDSDWAWMARSYLSEVEDRGTAYKVQSLLGDADYPGFWGVGHQAVRSRVKRLRDDEWIQGTGTLVRPGPRLKHWLADNEGEDDG
jgi:hypothetical protein